MQKNGEETTCATVVLYFRSILAEWMLTTFFWTVIFSQIVNSTRQGWDPAVTSLTTSLLAALTAYSLIAIYGEISGAHFNPAVTFGFLATLRIDVIKAILFIVAQLVGSITAVGLVMLMFPNPSDVGDILTLDPNQPIFNLFATEFILTAFLVSTIFFAVIEDVKQDKSVIKINSDDVSDIKESGITIYNTSSNSKHGFAPFIIGFMFFSLSLMGGGVSGAAFNPCRLFGPAVISGNWNNQWVYWVAELSGGVAGAGLIHLLHLSGLIGNRIDVEKRVQTPGEPPSPSSKSSGRGRSNTYLPVNDQELTLSKNKKQKSEFDFE